MSLRRLFKWSVVSVLFTLVTSCNLEIPNSGVTVTNGGGGSTTSTFTCSAVPTATAQSGVAVAITVSATGGTVPYSISGAGTFDSSTSISRTYTNSTTSQTTVDDEVTVTDAVSNTATCFFTVTVAPSGSNTGSALACTLVGSPTTQLVGGNVDFAVTVTGGTMPYTFTSLNPGDNSATVVSRLASVSSAQAQAIISYGSQGLKTAVAYVSDSDGDVASCSEATMVVPVPSVTVSVSPSGTVSDGTTVTLVATPSNFTSTPTYTFTTSEPNIQITPSGASATVVATDNANHNFNVKVTATNGVQTASVNAPISFSQSVALNCSLSYSPGAYIPGDTVAFTVTASDGETLQITQMTASNGQVVAYQGASASVEFNASGTQTVTATAQSTSTGKYCNSGSSLQASISIGSVTAIPVLTCSLYSSSNPAYAGNTFVASVIPSYNNGYVQITGISTDNYANGNFSLNPGDLSANVTIYNSNTYLLTVTVEDVSTGATTTCSTQEIVLGGYVY